MVSTEPGMVHAACMCMFVCGEGGGAIGTFLAYIDRGGFNLIHTTFIP